MCQVGEQRGQDGLGAGGAQIIISWYGSRNARTQCPPTEGIWETGKPTASGILTAGAGPSRGENISSPAERATRTVTVADISSIAATPSNEGSRHSVKRTSSLTPESKERRPALGRGCTLLSFLGRAGKLRVVFCLCLVLCAFCVFVFRTYFSFHR